MRVHRIVCFTAVAGTLALLLGSVAGRLGAQSPRDVRLRAAVRERPISIDRGAVALWQSLLKLHTRASLLMIVAHPDDEDGGLLTYESRGEGARVALLTLNRGEAGQNLMNSDYFDAMGLLRSEELLAADDYYGVQQYFTRVIDFGFSKSKEETLRKWTLERPLYDAVRVVRMTRPLAVASVFVGGPSDGHGHHQLSGQIAQEVFKDAGDPNVFPDQIRAGLRPWAPLKVYARVPTFSVRGNQIFDYANDQVYPLRFFDYITGRWIEGQLSTDLVVPEGRYDPLLGASFSQIGREGLGFQKSQNGGPVVPFPGPAESAYHRFASSVPVSREEDSVFAGIDVSLAGIADLARGQNDAFLIAGLAKVNGYVEQAMKQFDARRPVTVAPILAAGSAANLDLIHQVSSSSLSAGAKYDVIYELDVKQTQFNNALAEALSLSVRVTVSPARAPAGPFRGPIASFRVTIPGQTFDLDVHAADMSSVAVAIRRISVETPQGEPWTVTPQGEAPTTLDARQVVSQVFAVHVADNAGNTRPYFTRDSDEDPYFRIDDPQYLNLPFEPYPVSGWVDFEYQGATVRLGQVAQTLERERGLGEVAEPLLVAPAISLWISPQAGVVPVGVKSFPVSVLVHNNEKGAANGTVRLELPAGWNATPPAAPFSFEKDDQSIQVRFDVHPSSVAATAYKLQAVADYNGRRYREGYRMIGYPGLRPYPLYRPAVYQASGADVKIAPSLKVAYVVGTGDDVPQSLEDFGIEPVFLTAEDIASGDLARFNAIILGVRAYSARPELAAYNQRLLDYVHRGGVLIVQYQDRDYDHNFGPYPLSLGRGDTVTQEHCQVVFLQPDNPALHWPNRIDQQDFQGWVEERGHGYPDSWDPRWQAVFEMHDDGQDPQKGGVLIAGYGKGEYVYVALALYRQLPEGVPGSYRIIANLLSLAENPALHSGKGEPGH